MARDYDNFTAAFKAGQDTLTTRNGGAGILVDDSFKYLRPVTIDCEDGPRALVRVELFAVE